MLAPSLANAVLPCLASVQLAYWVAWSGSLALSIALVVLMWTRWGQSRPLQKCAALSLLVHLVLAFLAMTVRIVVGDGGGGGGGGVPIRVRIVQDRGPATTLTNVTTVSNTVNDMAAPQLLTLPPVDNPLTPAADMPSKPIKPEVADRPADSVKSTADKPDVLMAPVLLADTRPEKTAAASKTPDASPKPSAKQPTSVANSIPGS